MILLLSRTRCAQNRLKRIHMLSWRIRERQTTKQLKNILESQVLATNGNLMDICWLLVAINKKLITINGH